MSERVKISDLKDHKSNSFFFDNIEGDAWSEFLDSVRTSGVIVPIIITQDNVIVSGHQRVRACKALHIDEIEAEVREFNDEDEILKQLIEINIRQRGMGNSNPVKFGRCLAELERIYGVRNGSGGMPDPNNSGGKSQGDLASELGISVDTLRSYKKLAQAIPEMQDLVESGKVTKTIALRLLHELSEDEQRQLAVEVSGIDEQLSGREIEFYKNRIKTLTDENNALREQPHVIKEVEVPPEDYEETKEKLSSAQDELSKTETKLSDAKREISENEKEIEKLNKKISEMKNKSNKIDNLSINMFIEQCRGFVKTAKAQGKTLLKGKDTSNWGDMHDCIDALTELVEWAQSFSSELSINQSQET